MAFQLVHHGAEQTQYYHVQTAVLSRKLAIWLKFDANPCMNTVGRFKACK
ncbi:MAG TPA: hypothetical protein VKT77_12410 [Chthonomonadaceae bacterium]|nr:hypothetical protein [Chthonomonadaceae bacterium]